MGWLWSSSTAATPSAAQGNAPQNSQLEPDHAAAPQQAPSPKAPTHDEIIDKELQSFLQELEAGSKPSSTKYNRVPTQPPSLDGSHPTASDEPLGDQILPTTMSCRDAFDAAFYCNSMGGQFNHLYRYGSVGSCSENWNDFWFCMRTRTHGDREKQEAIKARYRDKVARKYPRGEFGRSSEDVWKSRDKKVEWGEAFKTPFPEFKGTDEEWNRMERENRAKFLSDTNPSS